MSGDITTQLHKRLKHSTRDSISLYDGKKHSTEFWRQDALALPHLTSPISFPSTSRCSEQCAR